MRPTFTGFDAVTPRGGSVSLSPGTGPGGRDELLYAPPAVPFLGDDAFTVTVGDGTGQQTDSSATVSARPLDLAGYWPLDEGTGFFAADVSCVARP